VAVPGFYAGNALIAHPFLSDPAPTLAFPGGAAPLPPSAVVDFRATVEPEGGYRPALHRAALASISRAGGVLTFEFRSDAPGLAGTALRFRASEAEAEWTTLEADAELDAGGPAPAGPCGGAPLWSGLMAVGPLGPILALLPDGGRAEGEVRVEPALAGPRPGGSTRAIAVGNLDRTRWTSAPDADSGAVPPLVVVAAGCLTGDVRIRAGRNATIRQDASAGTIELGASVGAGEGEPCGEVPLHPGEAPPEGSPFLSGGPSCRGLITSISGAEGRAIRAVGRSGVTVSVDPDAPHRLLVGPASSGALGCGEG